MTDAAAPRYAIVELMGHRRLGAQVREVTFCGAQLLELTVLAKPEFVQLVSPASLYALTWCDEAAARKVHAASWSPRPHPPELTANVDPDGADPDDDDDDDEVNPIGNLCHDCGAQPGQPCAPDCDGPAVGTDNNDRPLPCADCGAAVGELCDPGCPGTPRVPVTEG